MTVKLIDVGNYQCRAIHGETMGPDTLYCGRPVTEGRGYCTDCFATFFTRSVRLPKEEHKPRRRNQVFGLAQRPR